MTEDQSSDVRHLPTANAWDLKTSCVVQNLSLVATRRADRLSDSTRYPVPLLKSGPHRGRQGVPGDLWFTLNRDPFFGSQSRHPGSGLLGPRFTSFSSVCPKTTLRQPTLRTARPRRWTETIDGSCRQGPSSSLWVRSSQSPEPNIDRGSLDEPQ
jgi:hypothetical protein